jgi:hypothetical protein
MSVQGVIKNRLEEPNQTSAGNVMGLPSASPFADFTSSDATFSFQLDSHSIERLLRFRTRTAQTFTSPVMVKLYEGEIMRLAHKVRTSLSFENDFFSYNSRTRAWLIGICKAPLPYACYFSSNGHS